jgi:hypothetical protein
LLHPDRHLDWRAIAPALHQAVLLPLQVGDGVGDPNSKPNQQYQDRNRDQIHDHPMAIIDWFVVLFFEPREVIEVIIDRLRGD